MYDVIVILIITLVQLFQLQFDAAPDINVKHNVYEKVFIFLTS